MAPRMYNAGAACALAQVGLLKTAEYDDVPLLIAGGAAAGTPFLGLIGEKPLRHTPSINPAIPHAQSLEELAKGMKPGDVLVTTTPGPGFYKTPQTTVTGAPFHHVVPVVDVDPVTKRPRVLIESDALYDYPTKSPKTGPRAQPWDAAEALQKKYPEVIHLRPTEPLSPEQLEKMRKDLVARAKRPYSTGQAVKNWLYDIFVPKLSKKPGVICQGSVCSTAPAQALYEATGRRVVGNKPVARLLPVDYVRSPLFEPVAAHMPSGGIGPKSRLIRRLGSRAGLALLLGTSAMLGAEALTHRS